MNFHWLLILFLGAPACRAATIEETFDTDPAPRGWQLFGEDGLFVWSAEDQRLAVTWDSSRSNSYFYLPLRTILTEADDFELGFDLGLDDIAIGTTPGKPFTFEIAVGVIGFADATRDEFRRGSGIHPDRGARNAVEFDYFPDSGFGATVAPTVISTNNRIVFSSNHPLEMTTDDLFRVEMRYTAEDQTLRTELRRNGVSYGLDPGNSIRELVLTGFPGFKVDTLAVMSYSDEGQTPASLSGSVLAHGWIDNVTLTMPPPPLSTVTATIHEGRWRVQFESRAGWVYRAEWTQDFEAWMPGNAVEGVDGLIVLEEELPAGRAWFYRVGAWKP